MWHFDKVDSDEPVQPPFKLQTPNDVQTVAEQSYNIRVTSKGSDQSAHMRRLIRGFAGRAYHIVGNLMSRLTCSCEVCCLVFQQCFSLVGIYLGLNQYLSNKSMRIKCLAQGHHIASMVGFEPATYLLHFLA